MISIACLIYRSTRYADAVWQSVHRWTPHLADGRARFFFVANDATEAMMEHLTARGYPFVVQRNAVLTQDEMMRRGYGPPEYIHRVYRGWNRALFESEDWAVLINSDHMFSPGWLDALGRESREDRVVASKLVERRHEKFGMFPGAHEQNFGSHPDTFDENGFLEFCGKVSRQGVEAGYAFMPCMMWRPKGLLAGMFPEGNIGKPGRFVVARYGDQDFFGRLDRIGVKHVTVTDSLVYHFKEGEMSE